MALANINETSTSSAKLVETTDRPLGVALVSTAKATKQTAADDLMQLAAVVQRGDEGVKSVACNKLSVIADQIRFLQEQAKQILEKAKRDSELHHAACNIVKKPGGVYYLYEKASGQKFISIVSPEEWGANSPYKFHGGYRMEFDRSWTTLDDLKKKDEENALLNTVLHSKQGIIRAAISMDTTGPIQN